MSVPTPTIGRISGRIGIVGAGILGVRIARELTGPGADGEPTNDGVVLVTRRADRRDQLASSFGSAVQVVLDPDDAVELPADVTTVVVARESLGHPQVVRRQLAAGRDVVSTADDPEVVEELLELEVEARARQATVVAGAAMSPGLTCLLARHAAGELDHVDEIHVARHGAAGPACARQRLRALRGSGVDWRDGDWVRRAGFSGRELCWFPDPVAALDCYRGALAEPLLLVPAFPAARRVTARLAASRRDRALAPFPVLLPPPSEGGLGAVRVELRGERAGQRHSVVYGALDRPAVAAAAVAAVTALRLGARRTTEQQAEPGGPGAAGGVVGLASLGDPLPMLRELARRGVRAARLDPRNLAQRVQFPAQRAEEHHAE